MRINETLKKPMLEAKYLNVDNTDRYRPIIRLFYLNYEKLKYWIYQEEVYEELKEDPYFSGLYAGAVPAGSYGTDRLGESDHHAGYQKSYHD